MESQFHFLKVEWPDLHDAASKAESLAYPDPRAACFYARRGLEIVVHWVFKHVARPAPELSADERTAVKQVARELLAKLKQLLVLNWRQKSTARSQLKLAIEDVLDSGLPRAYTPELYQQKCSAVFEHFYESYPERDAGVYATAN